MKYKQSLSPASKLLMVLVLLVLAMPFVSAQSNDEQDEDNPNAPKTLDAVTVTAQKRTEDVQDVPVAVAVLTGEKLDVLGSGGLDIRFLSSRLPSLQIESSFGRTIPRFYIRGFGNTDFDLNASQPVSLVYDDVVLENPIIKGFPIFDLDRIENLRGPQGTLFGRNTPAGIVKFDSKRPTQALDGYAQVSYGSFNAVNFEGAVGGGLSDSWSTRFSILYQRRSDYVDNLFTGEDDALEGFDDAAARLQFLYDNGSSFEALFNIHARTLEGTARLFRANIFEPGSSELVEDFDRDEVAFDGQNFQDLDTLGASARLSWDLGRTTLTSITGYETADYLSRGDVDGGFGASFAPPFGPGFIPFPAESADGLPAHDQITQELRLASNEWGRFDWQVGAFYFYEDITIDSFNFDTLGGGVQNGFVQQEQQTNAFALFVSGDYDLTDDFKLRAGLRFSHDDKDFVAERFESPIGAGPTGPIRVNPDDSEVTWDLSGTYTLSEGINLYGRVARGFRAPSIQGRLLFGDTVSVADTETVVSYELGLKTLLAGGRARLNFSLFNYVVDNQQLTAVGGQANFNTLVNADQTVGRGFEFDLDAFLTDDLVVTAGLSYNDTEIQDDTLAIQPCGAPCTVLDPAGPVAGTVLIDGNSLPQAPEWVFNFTARYTKSLGAGEVFVYTDWAYRSDISFFLYESVEFNGDDLLEGGLRVGYAWDFGGQEAALFVRNITDNESIVGAIDFNNLTGFVNEPRTWGAEYTYRF